MTPAGVALASVLGSAANGIFAQEVPVVDGHLGSCTVSFTVTDEQKKPIYDAKIDVTIRYGFLGLHKSELQVGTNSEGKARVAGIPEKSKKPFEFRISRGEAFKTIEYDPSPRCRATYDVVLRTR